MNDMAPTPVRQLFRQLNWTNRLARICDCPLTAAPPLQGQSAMQLYGHRQDAQDRLRGNLKIKLLSALPYIECTPQRYDRWIYAYIYTIYIYTIYGMYSTMHHIWIYDISMSCAPRPDLFISHYSHVFDATFVGSFNALPLSPLRPCPSLAHSSRRGNYLRGQRGKWK